MATTTAIIMPKNKVLRRWPAIVATLGAAVAILALTASYTDGLVAVQTVAQPRTSNFLLKNSDTAEIGTAPTRNVILRALQADPLNQNIFNTAMMQIGRPDPRRLPAPAWFAVLARYGWRSTPALQNLIYYHATRNEIAPLLDIGDALFRRERQTAQVTAVFSLAERDPAFRGDIVRRLRQRPAWRHPFLLAGNVLTDPAAIEGRYQTLRALQRSGDVLPEAELTAVLPVLVKAGRSADAFRLWSFGRRKIERPLNDTRFAQAAATLDQDDTAKPFNWRFLSGDNFDVTAGGQGSGGIVIHWNGQGVPVFATQQTSGPPGLYRMRITFDQENGAMIKSLGFRMMCDDQRVDFVPGSVVDPTNIDLNTARAVPCAFARLEVFGKPAGQRQDITMTLNAITLRHVTG